MGVETMKFLALAATVGLSLTIVTGADAASLNFDFTYDGTDTLVNPGSDDPSGAVMNVGDDFMLTMSAAGDDFWSVDGTYDNVFAPMTFAVEEIATRAVDVTSTFWLDGVLVDTISEPGISESYVHIGPQLWTLSTGLEFDQVMVDLSFIATDTAGPTTVNTSNGLFINFGGASPNQPFTASSAISYNQVSAVPLPAGLPLILSGLAGLGLIARRRRRS